MCKVGSVAEHCEENEFGHITVVIRAVFQSERSTDLRTFLRYDTSLLRGSFAGTHSLDDVSQSSGALFPCLHPAIYTAASYIDMGNCMKSVTTREPEVQTPAPDPVPSMSPILSPRGHLFLANPSPLFDPKNSTSGTSLELRSEVLFDRSLEKSIDHLTQQMDQSRAWQEAKFSHVLAETRLIEAKLENLQRERPRPSLKLSVTSGDYLEVERMLEQQLGVINEEMQAIKQEVTTIAQQTQRMTATS